MTTFGERLGSLWLTIPLAIILIMGFLAFNALFLVWLERKVSARIQRRLGPTEVGPAGMFQTSADMLKLLGKQLVTPKHVDRITYLLAPVLAFAPVVASISLLPFAESVGFTDLDIGLVLVFAFGGFVIIAIFMAGWGSNNKYALLGAMRSVAQNVSYEVPLILASLSVVMMTRTMSLQGITQAQGDWFWYIWVQPLAAVIFFVAAVAETNRAPFDIPEAESELVAGFHTEYSGMRFAMFFFSEYSNMTIVSMVFTVLFLGGWHGPVVSGPWWFFLKTYVLVFIMMWFRWTFPRLRFDQLMTFCWVVLTPLSIANLIVTAVVLKLV